jgi:hypothetical protein
VNEQSAHLVRAITGPVILITIGVLFAFDRFTDFRFSQTWPVLLIVIGLLKLAGGGRNRFARRFDGYNPPPPPSTPPPPPPHYGDPGARP